MLREQQVVDSFSKIADGILSQYSNNIAAITAIKGARPPFDELMKELKQMEKELTGKAVKLIETYKKEIGSIPEELTTEIKQIITNVINQYVKSI